MKYRITHTTSYSYQNNAVFSQHLMRLRPRVLTGQSVLSSEIRMTPEPDHLGTNRDMFGNLA
ncbi:MAG: transglutaminase N-terminal domain-containing protein, partial [Pseudomonadota bacterium]